MLGKEKKFKKNVFLMFGFIVGNIKKIKYNQNSSKFYMFFNVFVGKPHGHFPIHIGMMPSILGLSPHGFVFEFLPQKVSYQLEVVHA